jgi:hypothetical protein
MLDASLLINLCNISPDSPPLAISHPLASRSQESRLNNTWTCSPFSSVW